MDELDAQTVQALEELHRVCLGMDLELQDDRPTEEEYQAAMAQAAQALQARAGGAGSVVTSAAWVAVNGL